MSILQKTEQGNYIIVPSPKTEITETAKTSPYREKKEARELQSLVKFAQKSGYKKEAEKALAKSEKLSVLERVGRGVTAFETGDALYGSLYEDKNFLKTYAMGIVKGLGSAITGKDYRKEDPKKTFKDILTVEGMRDRPGKIDPVDIAGLAGDIFIDPTTFVGAFIGKGIAKSIKVGYGIGKKIPVAGKGIAASEDALKTLFQPFYKVEKLGEAGKAYRASYETYVKGTRNAVKDFLDESATKAAAAEKIAGKAVGAEVAVAKEAGELTGNKLVDDIVGELDNIQKTFTKAEMEKGILPKTLPNYVHHLLSPEAMQAIRKGGVDFSGMIKPIRVKLGAAKGRKLQGTIQEINNELREKLGYNLFEEDYFKAFAKRGVDSMQAIKTYDFLKSTAAKFGKKSEVDIIDDFGVKWISSKAPQLKGFKFPEPIARHMDEVQKILSNDEATNALVRTYDKVLNFWKGTVTGYFPAFHTRNALAGIFNNWLAGITNPKLYYDAEKILGGAKGSITSKAGKVFSYDELRTLIKEYGITGQTGYLDVSNYLQKTINPTVAQKFKEAPTRVMGAVENRLRAPLFVDGLMKNLTAEQAAKRVIKYHFDYMPEGLTGFEKTIMKRIIPFYTWTRNNIPLQIEQIVMQPGKFASVFKTQRAAGLTPSAEEEQNLPRWLRERFVVKGEGGYWSGIGLPIEDMTEKIADPLRGFGISLSPLIKTPLELMTGYNVFKERIISEDVYGKQYKNMPEPIKKWMEFKKDGNYYTVNPHKKYWLELIGARGLSTALKLSNTSEDRKSLWTLITTITKYEYDIDSLKQWSTKEKREELEKALFEAGLLRKFEKYYEPK